MKTDDNLHSKSSFQAVLMISFLVLFFPPSNPRDRRNVFFPRCWCTDILERNHFLDNKTTTLTSSVSCFHSVSISYRLCSICTAPQIAIWVSEVHLHLNCSFRCCCRCCWSLYHLSFQLGFLCSFSLQFLFSCSTSAPVAEFSVKSFQKLFFLFSKRAIFIPLFFLFLSPPFLVLFVLFGD
jgi:hypothetical protein